MSTIGSSSTYSIGANAFKGMPGLASGVDTAAMVEGMLSGTQAKIDKASGEKQQLQWKQQIYRDVIAQISSFQNKFFNFTSNTNIMSSAFFNAMSAVSSSSAVKTTATSNAASGSNSIQVAQLAKSSSVKSGKPVSGTLRGEINADAFEGRLVMDVGGEEVTIDLAKALADANLPADAGEADKKKVIADAISSAKLSDGTSAGLTADVDEKGIMTISSASDMMVLSKSSALGLSMAGVNVNTKNNQLGEIYGRPNGEAKVSIDFNLNGISKTIELDKADIVKDSSGNYDKLQAKLDKAFGVNNIKVSAGTGTEISFNLKDAGQQITISGNKSGLEALGVISGQSNKIGAGMKLKDIAFNNKLQGDKFSFTINGEKFDFTGEDSLSKVTTEINKRTGAGVKLTYNNMEDKFTIESTSTGAGFDVQLEDTTGNLLGAMFGKGITSGGTVASKALTKNEIASEKDSGAGKFPIKGGAFKIKVNNQDFTINLKDTEDLYTEEEAIKTINEQLASKYGYNNDGEENIKITGSGDDIKLVVNNGATVSFESAKTNSDGSIDPSDLAASLGFTNKTAGKSNEATADMTLAELGLAEAGTTLGDKKLEELDGFKADGTGNFTLKNGRIELTNITGDKSATDISSDFNDDIMMKLFGSKTVSVGTSDTTDPPKTTIGQNAIVNINGVQTERTSNIFTVGGIQYELKATTGEYDKDTVDTTKFETDAEGNWIVGGKADPAIAKVETTRNTEQIMSGIKSFVEEYNKIVESLNKLLEEKSSFRDYSPLTEAQKKDMTDKEVELWEEKSKTGLVRNDNDISGLLAGMRGTLYAKPTGSIYGMYDLGIETSSDWKANGKLTLDESKLRQMIEVDPQGVEAVFTNGSDGVLQQMNAVMNKAAKTSSGDPGSLVKLAGVVGKGSENSNTLTKRLGDIDEKLKILKRKYQTERSRYWKQFSNMEKTMSQLNSQTGWITQQFGG